VLGRRKMVGPDEPIYGLFKFGKREHLEFLRRDGLLFMRPLAEFAKLELDMARGDCFEGTTRIIQPQHVKNLVFEGPGFGMHAINPSSLVGPVRFGTGETASCNVYCMFAATDLVDGESVSRQNFQFGDSFVDVTKIDEFLDRAIEAARNAGLNHFESRFVEYFDPESYSGEVGRFRKRSTFAYQSEFRIAVEPGSVMPRCLSIGSLLDITSEVLPMSDVNEYLDLKVKGADVVGLPSH
jgi:hypothetical protein